MTLPHAPTLAKVVNGIIEYLNDLCNSLGSFKIKSKLKLSFIALSFSLLFPFKGQVKPTLAHFLNISVKPTPPLFANFPYDSSL